MRRLSCRLVLAAALVSAGVVLSACQMAGEAKGPAPDGVTATAVAGDAIEVTTLDAVPGEAAAPPAAPDAKPAGTATAAAQAAPGTNPEAEPVVETATPAPTPDLTETPVTPKSERQLACEKKKGNWTRVGKGEARACVYQTKDAGKRCERESQCDGVCLARSGTCSPFKPLYGCNEILQDNGARVTLCLD